MNPVGEYECPQKDQQYSYWGGTYSSDSHMRSECYFVLLVYANMMASIIKNDHD